MTAPGVVRPLTLTRRIAELSAVQKEALTLLGYALNLRQFGEKAPGGNETWSAFDAKAEHFLRHQNTPQVMAAQEWAGLAYEMWGLLRAAAPDGSCDPTVWEAARSVLSHRLVAALSGQAGSWGTDDSDG